MPPLASATRVPAETGYRAVVAAAVVLGSFLRLHQITRQVILDDEWHALVAAVNEGYRYLLTHFGAADYCIPLAAAYRLALDTVGLSEMVLRAPVLLLGLASLVAFPWLVRGLVGGATASSFALLLAVSPLHVYFSRYARPYAASVFFSFVAAVAFYKWWSGGPRPWAHAYAVCAAIGAWFHLTVAPVVVAPLAFSLAAWVGRIGPRRPREITGVGLEAGLATLALLAAPLWVDHATLAAKTGRVSVDVETLAGAAQLLAGTRHGWLIAALLALTVLGAIDLARRRGSLLVYALTLALLQVVPLVLMEPAGVRIPIVFARYVLPILPWLLLLAAAGLATLLARLTAPFGRAALALPVAVTALLLAAGPLPQIYYHPNNWTNHAVFQYLYDPTNAYNRRYRALPTVNPFYLRLANEPPGSLTLLEAPWHYESASNAYPFYQRAHRQWMVVGFVRAEAEGERAPSRAPELGSVHRRHFRNFVHVGAQAELAARGVDYVIFHKDLDAELPTTMRRQPSPPVAPWIDHYRSVYGPPVYEDAVIAVFEVNRPPVARAPVDGPPAQADRDMKRQDCRG